jgi:hypothetical protein
MRWIVRAWRRWRARPVVTRIYPDNGQGPRS